MIIKDCFIWVDILFCKILLLVFERL